MPSSERRLTIGWSASVVRPGARVSRWPARLPLSTAETYMGSSGARSAVSYQLYKWPW